MKALDKLILEILDNEQPKNVNELVQLVQQQIDASPETVENEIKNLHQNGFVSFEDSIQSEYNFFGFILARNNYWFWFTIAISFLSFVSIIFVPGTNIPASYLRYIFSFILVAFLPGYCLTEALFPRKISLDIIERIVFSIGLSFALTALVGLFLSFSSLRLTLGTALPTLGSLVIILSLIALIRKYKLQ
ncbi:MAG: DUF1616 domain-containing protein [Candidatus Bathyarchaeota archaeon]